MDSSVFEEALSEDLEAEIFFSSFAIYFSIPRIVSMSLLSVSYSSSEKESLFESTALARESA